MPLSCSLCGSGKGVKALVEFKWLLDPNCLSIYTLFICVCLCIYTLSMLQCCTLMWSIAGERKTTTASSLFQQLFCFRASFAVCWGHFTSAAGRNQLPGLQCRWSSSNQLLCLVVWCPESVVGVEQTTSFSGVFFLAYSWEHRMRALKVTAKLWDEAPRALESLA